METPYLIAHRVRGEAAFDVAIQMTVEGYDEPWWIIPTSGHRAYPYWHEELGTLLAIFQNENNESIRGTNIPCPPDWPDHYQCDIDADTLRQINPTDIAKAHTLLEQLGLMKKPEPFARRV